MEAASTQEGYAMPISLNLNEAGKPEYDYYFQTREDLFEAHKAYVSPEKHLSLSVAVAVRALEV